jgi:hypothetical protein
MDPAIAVRTKPNIIPSIVDDVLRPSCEFVPLLPCNGFVKELGVFHWVLCGWVIGLFSGTTTVPAEALNVAGSAIIFATVFVMLLGVSFDHQGEYNELDMRCRVFVLELPVKPIVLQGYVSTPMQYGTDNKVEVL